MTKEFAIPNCNFETNNALDIPVLKMEGMAKYASLPAYAWRGANSVLAERAATWHFYTDDKNFTAIWNRDRAAPLRTKASAVVECNYSMNEDTPVAIGLELIYRKRWLARYWQQEGMKIFVDMHVPHKFQEWNLLGVPDGWSAFATRGVSSWHDGSLEDRLDEELELACQVAKTGVNLIVFAGGNRTGEWCRENNCQHIPYYKHVEKDEYDDEEERTTPRKPIDDPVSATG